jgi:hypothetical protein
MICICCKYTETAPKADLGKMTPSGYYLALEVNTYYYALSVYICMHLIPKKLCKQFISKFIISSKGSRGLCNGPRKEYRLGAAKTT